LRSVGLIRASVQAFILVR